MFRNRPNAHAATPRSATTDRHGPSDPLADLNSRLDALSERLGQLNAGAAAKMPPRREAAAPRSDDLAGITETVDRLMSKLDARSSARESRDPAAGRNGNAREAAGRGDASRGRIDAILETLDGIDRRMRNLPANGEAPSREQRPAAAGRGPSFEAADSEEEALRRAIDEITARQQTLDHDGHPIHNHNTGREAPRAARVVGSWDRTPAHGQPPADSRDRDASYDRERSRGRDEKSFGLPDVEHHFKALADKIDSLRQSDTEAAVERLRREIGNLRHEIERRDTVGLSDDDATMIRALGQKVETLSASQTDPRAVEALRDEIAELRQSVISGNVEGTLHSLESGYQHIVERLDEMRRTVGDPRLLVRLADRIDTIDSALKTIPQVGQINMLEQRVTSLARQIDGLSLDMNDPAIGQLESQIADLKGLFSGLDTQAAVATLDQQLRGLHDKIDGLERLAAEPPARPEPAGDGYLEAIERLSGQIEDLRDAMSGGRDADRFALIESNIASVAQKLDELEDARTQDDAILALERRIDDMIGRVEEIVPGADAGSGDAFAALEARINQIADRLDSFEPGRQMGDVAAFAELEETIQRIDEALQRTSGSDALGALDRKVASLAAQLDDLGRSPLDLSEMANLRDEIAGMRMAFSKPIPVDLTRLERQIHNLADKVNDRGSGFDANALAHLEDQVARIAQLLGDRSEQSEALGAIETALTHLDRRLDNNRDEAARAARDAAREAIAEFARERSVGGGSLDNDEQIRELQFHLDKLRATTVDSAERTQDTLVTLHDALQSISSKLTGFEPAKAEAQARGIAVNDTAGYDGGQSRDAGPDRFAAIGGATLDASAHPQRAAEPHHREPRGPLPGGTEDSRPLEPGAGRPEQSLSDLEHDAPYRPDMPREPQARRVELDPDAPLEPGAMAETLAPDPTGRDRKTDFIAAARRAAQAAAAEADGAADAKPSKKRSWFRRRKGESAMAAPERQDPAPRMEEPAPEDDIYATPLAGSGNGPDEDGGSGVSGVLKKYRRPLMIAAAGLMVIFLGNQLMKAFLTPVNETAAIEQSVAPAAPAPAAEEPAPAPVDEAPSLTPATPVDDRSSSIADPAGADSDPETTSAVGFDVAAAPDAPETAGPQADTARQARGDTTPDTVTAYAPTATPEAGSAPAALAMPPAAVGPIALRADAADGDPQAQFEVAARYTEGRGVRPDLKLAAKWYRYAAEQGFAPAQYRLGSLYEKGTGVAKDMDEARKWYRRAAEQGNTKAMHNLAVLYAEGASGAPDFSSAARWFDKAANAGVRDSQYNLGILHARGLGVAQDLKDSYKWFALAARQGDSDAGKKRDEIANALDRKGLAAARLAVETWRATPVDQKANTVTPREEWGAKPERSASARPQQPAPVQLTQQQLTQSAQQLLTELGYDPGPADGVSGPRTRDAVMDFQRKAGLPVTGQVDGRLIKALSKETI